ncbi:hypothetical protein CONLIGDRAFT_691269 [Coniochaeta ligniaria NRRL 30616]|uniref:DUF302 domain-containing protein n=1 Tax=Coniochaeta ligniaria NRRL 30616 TaxID=1408157 RepID=A0A1J7J6C3_9PEZI|nr:hypothetical protein CONLIGDRAFT_691269 [Coniochaeta ligniaria NRRL 30616]
MKILNLVMTACLSWAAIADATINPGNPVSDHIIHVGHRTIVSKRSFADTRVALEAAIPPLNMTFRTLLAANDIPGALEALKALPTLNDFIVPPRDFGSLVRVFNINGRNALQYEIGNPYTASKMAQYNLEVAVYAPIRVALLEDPVGVVKFVFDTPTTTFGQFADWRIDAVATKLDMALTQLCLFAGGWPSRWPISPES